MKFFREKRNYVVKVANVSTRAEVNVNVFESVGVSESLHIEVIREGKAVETRDVCSPPAPPAPPREPTVEWRRFFPEFPNADVLELCAEHLEKLAQIVMDATRRFG